MSDKPAIRPRVLVIEDDAEIAGLVAYQLTRGGYRVETAASGAEGLDALNREIPDLVVLDRMLPGLSGDEVLQAIRQGAATRTVPVLVVSAKREQFERIEGFELGADDYVTKPFSPRELMLRVGAILRRALADARESRGGGRVLTAGPLRVDLGAMQVTLDGVEVPVTPTELRVLKMLMERRGRTQDRQQLLEGAWSADPDAIRGIRTRTVDMHIRRLRTKLGAAGEWIETVRGFGYRFRAPE